MSMIHEIYDRGQIVIPKYIRDLLGWSRGTKLSFRVEENKVIIQDVQRFEEEWEEFTEELNISQKQIEKALKWANKTDIGVIYEHYGDILVKLGKGKEALEAYRNAIDSGEDEENIMPKINPITP